MIMTQAHKVVPITNPGAIVDNAAFTTAVIDTLGYDYLDIYVMFGAMDIAMATLKLQEGDTNSPSTDVTGGNFATLPATLPSATDDNTIFAWHVNLNGQRKRYFDVSATGGDGTAGTYMTAWAVLSRAEQTADTASERGLNQELFV